MQNTEDSAIGKRDGVNDKINEPAAGQERRANGRSRLIVDVFYDGRDATGIASTRDIGSGGLYLNTQSELPLGAILLLRIPFGQKQIVVNAEVVYSNPGSGVGLQFHGLSSEDEALLQELAID